MEGSLRLVITYKRVEGEAYTAGCTLPRTHRVAYTAGCTSPIPRVVYTAGCTSHTSGWVYTAGCTSHTSGCGIYPRVWYTSQGCTSGCGIPQGCQDCYLPGYTSGVSRLLHTHCWSISLASSLFPFHCWSILQPPCGYSLPVSLLAEVLASRP